MPQPIATEPAPGPADAPLLTHDAYLGRKYLPELDGLRALSILIVVSVHMKQHVWEWLAGTLGVTIFFVLSGYLITRLALIEERDRGRLSLGSFFVRRVLRLFPLYYLILALYAFLILGLRRFPEREAPFRGALPFYLVYFQEWPFFRGVNGTYENITFYQTWTLGIEEKFYLVWPLLCFVLWRQGPRVRLLGTPLLAIATATAPLWLGDQVGRFFYPYAQILLGCWAALILDDPALYARAARGVGLGWRPAAILAGLLALHFALPRVPPDLVRVDQMAYAVFVGLTLVLLLVRDGPVQRGLRWGPLLLLGRLSYAIYLIHLLAINVVDKVIPPGRPGVASAVAAFALTCLVAAGMAWVLHVAVERPCIALGRRLSRRILDRDRRPVRPVVTGPAVAR